MSSDVRILGAERRSVSLARNIAMRYVRSGFSTSLVSFMSFLSIAGLSLGVALLILVMSVMNGFEREVRVNVLGLIPHLTLTADKPLSAEEWQALDEVVRKNNSVIATSPVISSVGVAATATASRAILINGVDTDSAPFRRLENSLISGSLPTLEDSRWQLVLGATLARNLGVGVGDEVNLYSPKLSPNPLATLPTFRRFRVAAITRVGSEELDAKLATISLADARALLRVREPQSALRIETRDVLNADNVAQTLLKDLDAGLYLESWTVSLGAIYRNIEFSRGIVGLMLWLLIAIAAFNLVVSLVMIVRDKRNDIAILMTLGADRRTVSSIFFWQGLAIALVGICIGSIIGVVAAYWVGDIAALFERVSGVSLLNPEIYPIDFLPSQILISDLVRVALGVLALALLASIYPARQAAGLRPASALRGD